MAFFEVKVRDIDVFSHLSPFTLHQAAKRQFVIEVCNYELRII